MVNRIFIEKSPSVFSQLLRTFDTGKSVGKMSFGQLNYKIEFTVRVILHRVPLSVSVWSQLYNNFSDEVAASIFSTME